MFGPVRGLIGSGLLLSLTIIRVATALVPWFGERSTPSYLGLDALWLALTLVFELSLGRA